MIRHIELKNKYGFTIRGYLNRPDDSKDVVIFFHGFTGNLTESHFKFKKASSLFSKHNIASLRMCYTGNGESDGEFSDFTFEVALDDAKLMIDYISGLGFNNITLLGYSMGAIFASKLCNYHNVKDVILWSPAPSDKSFWDKMSANYVTLDNGNFYANGLEMNKDLYKALTNIDIKKEASIFNGNTLLVVGSSDEVVGMNGVNEYNSCFRKTKLEIIDGASHWYEKIAEQKELIELSLDFLLLNMQN